MTQVNLVNEQESVITEKDNIVIVKVIDTKRGGTSLDVSGYAPDLIKAGHVIIKETSSGEYKPMPTTEASSGNLATLGSVTGGSTYTNGTYENVPLSGGSGTGALATVVVSGAVVSTVTVTKVGKDYQVGDTLSADNSYIGGTGSGFSVPVATVSTTSASYGALPAGHTYEGVNIATIRKEKPFASILLRGTVNPAAAPYSMTSILSAFKTACPHILFSED